MGATVLIASVYYKNHIVLAKKTMSVNHTLILIYAALSQHGRYAVFADRYTTF